MENLNGEELIGKTIIKLDMNQIKDTLRLKFNDNTTLKIYAIGDCCSTSWFEHITGLDFLLGGKINSVTEAPKKVLEDQNENYTLTQIYGYNINTNKGTFSIEFRNSSNGYYGGYLTTDLDFYDEYEESTFKEIKEDF